MSPNEITPSVHPELEAQMALYEEPRIITTLGHIHTAHCYTGSNCTLIEGEDACVLVDTLSGELPGDAAAADFKAITDKPIKAIIVTHFHNDHVSGIFSFVSKEQIESGEVQVIGQKELITNRRRDSGTLAPIRNRRGAFQFGAHLDFGVTGGYGSAVGAAPSRGKAGFVDPTHPFEGSVDLDIGGVKIQVIHVPSETDDQSVVWLPDEKVLISADAVQGMTFPNIYALRGTQFRNPMQWATGLDTLRELEADILIPHHGPTVEGAEAVEELLSSYRDAIQYLHDQALRWINKGYTWDELADKVTMPEHFVGHPWLNEFYGSYKHSVRNIYTGYIGWFQGDAAELDPHPWKERAERYVAAMGGRDAVLAQAQEASDAGDYRWAMDIITWAVRADTNDMEAREIKAQSLRGWAYQQKNSTWRNWGLCQALELEDKLGDQLGASKMRPGQLLNYPVSGLLDLLGVRVIADEASDTHLTIGFVSTDTGDSHAIELRRCICQFHENLPKSCDATLRFPRKFLIEWASGGVSFDEGIENGTVTVEGDPDAVSSFFEKFEPMDGTGSFGMSVR
tara:strand:- start:100 stop:1800 length:1701 start_codon:yes stop_codon:yes gene_type:complete